MAEAAYSIKVNINDIKNAMGSLEEMVDSLDDLKDQLNDLIPKESLKNLDKLKKGFLAIKNIMSEIKDKVGGMADNLGRALSAVRNIAMTPIGIFGGAKDFFDSISQGSQLTSMNAKALRTQDSKLMGFTRAQQVFGMDGALTNVAENFHGSLATAEGLANFARLGLDGQKYLQSSKNGNGIESLFEFMKDMEKRIQESGGIDSLAANEVFNPALMGVSGLDTRNFMGIMSNMKGLENEYKKQAGSLKNVNPQLKQMERQINRTSIEFDKLKILIGGELYPIFADLAKNITNAIKPVFDEFKKGEGFKDLKKMLTQGASRISKTLTDPQALKELVNKFDDFLKLMKTVLLNLLKGVSYLPGVDSKLRDYANRELHSMEVQQNLKAGVKESYEKIKLKPDDALFGMYYQNYGKALEMGLKQNMGNKSFARENLNEAELNRMKNEITELQNKHKDKITFETTVVGDNKLKITYSVNKGKKQDIGTYEIVNMDGRNSR